MNKQDKDSAIHSLYKSKRLVLNYILDPDGNKIWLATTTNESEIFYRPVTQAEAIELCRKHQVPPEVLRVVEG